MNLTLDDLTLAASTPEPPAPVLAAPEPPAPFERRAVLSAAVDIATPQQFVDYLVDCANKRIGRSVVGISAPYVSAMARDAALRDAFLQADVLVPDGKGFVWGARTLGVPCGDRLAIPDLCERLLDEGNRRKWKVFVYGATAEMNAAAVTNVKTRFPNLAAVEGQHGYNQGEAEENAVIAKLRDEQFNLVIVARPSPDKEKFLKRCCHAAGVVGLAAGGYADILAGSKKRAPAIVQAAGMEWFYRLVQDPAHLWKRIGWANMRFAASVGWNRFWGVPRRAWFAQPALHISVLIGIVWLAYAKSLNAPYHFDDPEYILRNSAIRSLSTVNQITITAHRKVWWYSNALSYAMAKRFGRMDPKLGWPDVRFFRGWNIACHFIASMALYGLLRRCLKIGRNMRGESGDGEMRPIAAAAIFAAHPLCTEAVTYISGRDNGMGGMFYLLGLYCAAVAFERMGFGAVVTNANVATKTALRWPAWFWPSMFALIFGACAVLTKESHLTFPGAVVLVYFFFYRRGAAPTLSLGLLCGMVPALAALAWGAAGRYDGDLWLAVPVALVALTLGGLLGMPSRADAVHASNGRGFFQQRAGAGWAFLFVAVGLGAAAVLAFPYAYSRTIGAMTGYQGSSYIRSLCTQANALPQMFARAVLPVSFTTTPDFNIAQNLNIDHQFPTLSDPFDPRVMRGAGIILAMIVFGIVGAFRGWLASFGILLALLTLAPTNTVIEKGDVVSERNFYLTAAGGACVLAWLVGGIAFGLARRMESAAETSQPGHNTGVIAREAGLWTIIFACCFAGPFAAFTTLRNNEWGDPYRLWKSALQHSPNKMRVLYNFGVSAEAAKPPKLDEAEAAFTRAIAIGEDMSKRGAFRPDEAVDVKCFHLAYSRLAEIQLQRFVKGNRDDFKSLTSIKTTYENGLNRTAFDPDLAMTYAEFLIKIGQATETAPMLQRSLVLHSWADQLYMPLGIAHLELGEPQNAIHDLMLALRVKDEHSLGFTVDMSPEYRAQVSSFLGVAYARLKQPNEARAAFKESLRLNPESLIPILVGYNSPRNLQLMQEHTQDDVYNGISIVRRDVLVALRDAANELLAAPAPDLPSNLGEFKKLFDYEINRRDAYQKKRVEMGFKDNPDDEKN